MHAITNLQALFKKKYNQKVNLTRLRARFNFFKRHQQLVISLATLVFLLVASTIVITYGRGYRFGFGPGRIELSGTGLLVAESNPDGAQVFINDHLTTATDNTINLSPGEYTVRIFKQGYFPWQKKIKIQNEVVAKAQALLLATTPKLEALTDTGVQTVSIDPTMTKLAYTVSSGSARTNGIYVLDMSTRPILTLQNASTQIADDTSDLFSKADISWSPDGKQLLATVSAHLGTPTTYLLQASGLNQTPQDVTETLQTVHTTWQQLEANKDQARIAGLKEGLKALLTQNFNIISWSPDESKILYIASQSASLPLIITPRLVGFDATPDNRMIEKNSAYVYDVKEDKNYTIAKKVDPGCITAPTTCRQLLWFPDSAHLVYTANHLIQTVEFDGTNSTTVYGGPFTEGYVFPWPSDVKIVILTNLNNPTIPSNLYTIGLK